MTSFEKITTVAAVACAALALLLVSRLPAQAAETAPLAAEALAAAPAVTGNSLASALSAGADNNAAADPAAGTDIVLSLNHQVLLLAAGDDAKLTASVSAADGSTARPSAGDIRWSSSNPDVLVVSNSGTLIALSPGQANITAAIPDPERAENTLASAKCAVAVYPSGDLLAIAQEQENWTMKGFYRALADLQGKGSPWQRILCIGDSVTAGVQAGDGMLQWVPNYPLTMSAILGVPTFNHGVGGSAIWSGGNYSIIDSLDSYEKADAVFLLGGYNDWFYGVQCPIGDLDTPGTFTYDFDALCDRIAEQYPDADIFVVLPPTPHDHVGVEPYYDFSWLKAIEREVAEAHAFHVLNLPAEDILNGLEEDTWRTFFSDNVHMNDYGYLVLGTIITDKALIAKEEAELP